MTRTANAQATALPKQTIRCYILSNILEEICDATDDGDSFGFELAEWAERMMDCQTMDWVHEHPDLSITIEWPCWPEGRDRDRLHQLYDYYKQRWDAGVRPAIGATTPHDAERIRTSDQYIALARAIQARWARAGRR